MTVVRCLDCGAVIDLPEGIRSGDFVECPSCAGHALRVKEREGRWFATLAHRVSCPRCDRVVSLPEDARPGDTIECCGWRYRLTYEYGAFAAEE
jgi:DNA-directed RNA polymerase subunit RPC12/RpoP